MGTPRWPGEAAVAKIKVKTPVVELDGDEMTRIIWGIIRERLVLPYLDIDLKYFDLGIEHRDATSDRVTIESAHAIRQYGVGVKCATITADEARVREFSLKSMWRSPNGTIRNIVDGTIFREPIIRANAPRLVPHWRRPIVIGRHAYGDIYRVSEMRVPGPGRVSLVYQPADKGEHAQILSVHEFQGPGVAMGMHNTRASIEGFARASFNYGLTRDLPRLFLDQEHEPQGLRRPVQGHLPGGVRRGISRALRGRRPGLRAQTDR